MNALSRFAQNLESKGRALPVSDVIFYCLLTLLAHLALLLANRLLTENDLSSHLPSELRATSNFGFYLSVTSDLLFELMLFFAGWLFICGMAVLFDGQANARALFGWLGLCYLPRVLFSVIGFVILLIGPWGVDYSKLSDAETQAQLGPAFTYTLATGAYRWLSWGVNLSYLLVLALAIETTRRVCGLSWLKAALIPGLFVGMLFLLNRFAG